MNEQAQVKEYLQRQQIIRNYENINSTNNSSDANSSIREQQQRKF